MSDTPNIDHLLKHSRNLVSLLEDPHPGLCTWAQFYRENLDAITTFYIGHDKSVEVLKQLKEEEEAWGTMAETLEHWIAESHAGGWSTHQIEAQGKQSVACRLRAHKIRSIINAIEKQQNI